MATNNSFMTSFKMSPQKRGAHNRLGINFNRNCIKNRLEGPNYPRDGSPDVRMKSKFLKMRGRGGQCERGVLEEQDHLISKSANGYKILCVGDERVLAIQEVDCEFGTIFVRWKKFAKIDEIVELTLDILVCEEFDMVLLFSIHCDLTTMQTCRERWQLCVKENVELSAIYETMEDTIEKMKSRFQHTVVRWVIPHELDFLYYNEHINNERLSIASASNMIEQSNVYKKLLDKLCKRLQESNMELFKLVDIMNMQCYQRKDRLMTTSDGLNPSKYFYKKFFSVIGKYLKNTNFNFKRRFERLSENSRNDDHRRLLDEEEEILKRWQNRSRLSHFPLTEKKMHHFIHEKSRTPSYERFERSYPTCKRSPLPSPPDYIRCYKRNNSPSCYPKSHIFPKSSRCDSPCRDPYNASSSFMQRRYNSPYYQRDKRESVKRRMSPSTSAKKTSLGSGCIPTNSYVNQPHKSGVAPQSPIQQMQEKNMWENDVEYFLQSCGKKDVKSSSDDDWECNVQKFMQKIKDSPQARSKLSVSKCRSRSKSMERVRKQRSKDRKIGSRYKKRTSNKNENVAHHKDSKRQSTSVDKKDKSENIFDAKHIYSSSETCTSQQNYIFNSSSDEIITILKQNQTSEREFLRNLPPHKRKIVQAVWDAHNTECESYRANPRSHPLYNGLRDKYIAQKCKNLIVTPEAEQNWSKLWVIMMEIYMHKKWEDKKNNLNYVNEEEDEYVSITSPISLPSTAHSLPSSSYDIGLPLVSKRQDNLPSTSNSPSQNDCTVSSTSIDEENLQLVQMVKLLMQMSSYIGILADPLASLHKHMNECLSEGRSLSVAIDADSMMVLALIKGRLEKYLRSGCLGGMKEPIMQEVVEKLTRLVEEHKRKTVMEEENLESNIVVIAKATLGKSSKEVLATIKKHVW